MDGIESRQQLVEAFLEHTKQTASSATSKSASAPFAEFALVAGDDQLALAVDRHFEGSTATPNGDAQDLAVAALLGQSATHQALLSQAPSILKLDGGDSILAAALRSSGQIATIDERLLKGELLAKSVEHASLLAAAIERTPGIAAEVLAHFQKEQHAKVLAELPELLHALATHLPSALQTANKVTVDAVVSVTAACIFARESRRQTLGLRLTAVLTSLSAGPLDQLASALLLALAHTEPAVACNSASIQCCAMLLQSQSSEKVKQLANEVLQTALQWLVRRFAEDAVDTDSLLLAIDSLTTAIPFFAEAGIEPKKHLAEPTIEAGIRYRLDAPKPRALVAALCSQGAFSPASASRLAAFVAGHKQLADATKADASAAIILHSFVRAGAISDVLTQALLSSYGGSLSLTDRLLFASLQQVDRKQALDVWSQWSPDGTGSDLVEKLLALDPTRLLASCTGFNRSRRFESVSIATPHADNGESSTSRCYDPLMVLSLLSAATLERRLTGLEWLDLLRANVVSVVVCCLSSRSSHVRMLAMIVLGRAYAMIKAADISEDEQVILVLDLLRDLISDSQDPDDTEVPSLRFSTVLFFAHVLRSLAAPSNFTFPSFMRFLLQRPKYDVQDLPLLYNYLASSNDEHRSEKVFILRYLRDVLRHGGRDEWQLCRRRHVAELLMSMYPTQLAEASAKQARALVDDIFEVMCSQAHTAKDLLKRHGFLSWIATQQAAEAAPRILWMRLAISLSQQDDSTGPLLLMRSTQVLEILADGLARRQAIDDVEVVGSIAAATAGLLTRAVEQTTAGSILGISPQVVRSLLERLGNLASPSASISSSIQHDLIQAVASAASLWPDERQQFLELGSGLHLIQASPRS